MHRQQKLMLLWGFLGFVALAMATAMLAIVLPRGYVSDELMATILLVGAYALGGLVVVSVQRGMRWTARIAFVSLVISMLIYIAFIWFERSMSGDLEELVFKIATISLITGLVLTHRLLICPLRTQMFWGVVCRRAALITAALTGAVLVVGILSEGFFWWDDLFVRLLGLSAVLAAGTSIAAGAIAIFGPKPGDDQPGLLAQHIDVSLRCPRCEHDVCIKLNQEARCDHCKLKLRVEVEEPRCACGYLLYQLESDTCPECGKAIDPDDRWQGAAPKPA